MVRNRMATINQQPNMPKIVLEKIVIERFPYSGLKKEWMVQDIKVFSKEKELYYYQINALERVASTLYIAFHNSGGEQPNFDLIEEEYIQEGYNPKPINRACFWMATGSGKTLVLIKTIEHIDYLMVQGLIPKKEIMLLLPKDNLIIQLKREVKEYNQSHTSRPIKLIELSKYEDDRWGQASFLEEIKVYYYRSDLIRDERGEATLDYKTYENQGNWYVFLDEAHRGDSEYSNLKEYVNKFSAKGFLFNFSATFTDDIDIITTCYNFNLEKFITAGFGKNIFLSISSFRFNKRDEFSEEEKQKQVLKSFIIYTLISKSRKEGTYHVPLMMTLVNTVNKNDKGKDSDLKLFCDYMLKIAQEDSIAVNTLEAAKSELIEEFCNGVRCFFGDETLLITQKGIRDITLNDIREAAFNSRTKGDLEYYEGAKGNEIVFKLQTSTSPFALIRIGETEPFIKYYLNGYHKLSTYEVRDWFNELNQPTSSIKILLGSRTFYEGWDSNRPNVINYINIGKGDAKKYVPQSIGRGVRIQPKPDNTDRKRLNQNDPAKNRLLETLFIFSSDVKSVETILTAMKELGGKKEEKPKVVLYKEYPNIIDISPRTFELLLPVYKEREHTSSTALKYHLESECKERFKSLFSEMSPAAFLLSSYRSYSDNWSIEEYIALKDFINNNKFEDDSNKLFYNYNYLVSDLRRHILTKEKYVDGLRLLKEKEADDKENDIIHFKYIEVELDEVEKDNFIGKLRTVNNYGKLNKKQIEKQCPFEPSRASDLSYVKDYLERLEKISGEKSEVFNNLSIHKLANHYYQPLLFSMIERIDWINHIIKKESEKIFIDNLLNYIDNGKIESEWMFSKIDETLDKNIAMPYFTDNRYENFYPDFIFWIKNGADYRIVFVDPKASTYTDYERKVDGFEKYFGNKVFTYGKYKVTFELKLIGSYSGGKKYAEYWIPQNDFSWLK